MIGYASSTVLTRVPSNTTVVQEHVAARLTAEELALVSPRSSRKRVAEFVAGRIVAREAVGELLMRPSSSRTFHVLREGNGPTGCSLVALNDAGVVAPRVSISHADGFAAASACFGRVGLDLAAVQHQERSFVAEAFHHRELDRWSKWLGTGKLSALTLTTAFAAKEAALKWLCTGLALPLLAIEVLPLGGSSVERIGLSVSPIAFVAELHQRGASNPHVLLGRVARIEDVISLVFIEPSTRIDATSSLTPTREYLLQRFI